MMRRADRQVPLLTSALCHVWEFALAYLAILAVVVLVLMD